MLFIDFDRHNDRRISIPKINATLRAAGIQYRAIRFSRSRRGWHIAIVLRRMVTAYERIALEAMLGDDPMRVAMNYARAKNFRSAPEYWRQRSDIFYSRKYEL